MNINALYFSATDTSKKTVHCIAQVLHKKLNITTPVNVHDFTLPENRSFAPKYSSQDIVVIGLPVYAGRVPNILLEYLNSIEGNGALAVALVLYGNRNYDDALSELVHILSKENFTIVGAGAFIGEHSFSKILAKNRPDCEDFVIAEKLAADIASKISSSSTFSSVEVKGTYPPRAYYKPLDPDANPVDIRKVKPKTNSSCIDCKLCSITCPMGSIDFDDVSKIEGICIKCGSCIKKCPTGAKYYDDQDYLRHKNELEADFSKRKSPETFI
ncbi:flavodoxin family protein [Proteocatella sphenisci]|uniref:flavodoxin family protein n=1 Tax=Proteocatella sphenisci TaxID=181070 RepID=UPI000490B6EC|nr:EFR1 family ferrodoxin [Proteocatella sphenisci]